MDPRHLKRRTIVQEIFANSFFKQKASPTTINILKHLHKIDQLISKTAPKFPISKIAKTDLSILRLSIYELIVKKKEPPKVIINEAIELAKEFSSEKSAKFINAVLGKIYSQYYDKKN